MDNEQKKINMISFTNTSDTSEKRSQRASSVQKLCEIAEELVSLQLGKLGLSVTVMELKCTEPGCPPLETAFAVLDKGIDCKFKVLKELEKVTRDEIVDAIQAWVRGDAPPCGCDFNVPTVGSGSMATKQTYAPEEMHEVDMHFLDALENGTM